MKLWESKDNPYEDYYSWEHWIVDLLPDDFADNFTELDMGTKTNLYAIFYQLTEEKVQ